MQPVATAAEMRRIDRDAMARGIPEAALMESAGRSVAEEVRNAFPRARCAVVLCGPGNNGGDGFVAARYLKNAGLDVIVFSTRAPEQSAPLCASYARSLEHLGVPLRSIAETGEAKETLRHALQRADVVVDALLGTGAGGALRGGVATAARALVDSRAPVVAVDLPTGVDADTAKVHPLAVRAALTVALAAYKPAHLFLPGRLHCGRTVVADIGIPRAWIAAGTHIRHMDRATAAAWMPARPLDGHKGTFGRLLVIAGSATMPGAAVLALRGAIGAGTGLVRWAGPAAVQAAVAAQLPEATLRPVPAWKDASAAERKAFLDELGAYNAVAIGPGLGGGDGVSALVRDVLRHAPVPLVVDADGLNHLAAQGAWPGGRAAPVLPVLTPHVGEMARLLGVENGVVRADPLEAARRAAARYDAVVLLKGVPTVVARPSGEAMVVTAGNPVLATGGSGDVLTGIIGGLLAQGMPPWQAAALGAYWHGRAADALKAEGSDAGYPASAIAARLPQVRQEILREEDWRADG